LDSHTLARARKPILVDPSAAIDSAIASLHARHSELDGKLVPNRDGKVDMAVANAMTGVEQRIRALEELRARALAGEGGITKAQIDEAAGKKVARPPPHPPPRLPPLPSDITTAEERQVYLDREKRREGEADPLSVPQRERMSAIRDKVTGIAIERIESMLKEFGVCAGERENVAVSYSEGRNAAITMVLAHIRTLQRQSMISFMPSPTKQRALIWKRKKRSSRRSRRTPPTFRSRWILEAAPDGMPSYFQNGSSKSSATISRGAWSMSLVRNA
jgi:hypothetical protein